MNDLNKIVANDHVRGEADAPLTVIQYGDYACPHTRASAAVIETVEGRLGASIRFVFRHFPLRHLHANAQALSEIAEAAGALGHFWETHDRLMSHRRGLSLDDVMSDLAAANVDVHALRERLGEVAIKVRIDRDVDQGARAGVHSTPSWFFNGVLWDGHYHVETILGRAKAALQKETNS